MNRKIIVGIVILLLGTMTTLDAQINSEVKIRPVSKPLESEVVSATYTPRDSPYDQINLKERRVLRYDHIREADVMWQKRIWQVIDVREKMNLSFAFPERPLVTVMLENIKAGKMKAYSAIDDKFTTEMSYDEIEDRMSLVDTFRTYNPDTYEETLIVARNDFDPTTVKRFRVKEDWFFDEETSTMKVRILGIAPLREELDDYGNVRYEIPMFWVYYPDCREPLAREAAYNPMNDVHAMSWEDLFEMRYFSSHIVKASNPYDRRIEDYKEGTDMVYEAQKIKDQIRAFESDLWSY